GPLAPLVIGLALTAMVYMGGHVSGAHYTPAVSFGLLLRGVITPAIFGLYCVTQLLAGSLAFAVAFLISGANGGIHPGPGVYWYSSLTADVLSTTALELGVMYVAAYRQTARSSYYVLANALPVARCSLSA